MAKWNVGILIVAALFVSCKSNSSRKEQHVADGRWMLPNSNIDSLPEASKQSLTMVYNNNMLENRDVTFRDERLLTMRSVHTDYNKLPVYKTREEWETRKEYLRQQILVSAGLWPLPEKLPLQPKYYHKIDHDDYIVETVAIQPYPGFYLGGNIYRPKGKGPFPAVLCPHGHFEYGRLTNDDTTSIPGRCINLARQGYVVFAYDMAGYCDTRNVSHRFANDSISALYGINLFGLQLWNSIRALDFLLSLPQVDSTRIGITGASGGGTQTFFLAAVDDRFHVAAPVNMVSNTMQGGDICENAPGLRVNTFNVELASMIAPKPLLLVSNTQDWTFDTRNTVMPMMRSIYELYNEVNSLENKHFDYPHNYNKAGREAVYSWFEKWLLHNDTADDFKEKPFVVDPDTVLLAFLNKPIGDSYENKKTFEELPASAFHRVPDNLLDENELIQLMKDIAKQQLQKYWPKEKSGLKNFKDIYGTAVQHLIGASTPKEDITCKIIDRSKGSNFIATQILITEKYKNEWIPCILYQPLAPTNSTVILTAHDGKSHWVSSGVSSPDNKIIDLLKAGFNVLAPDLFKQGEHVLQDTTNTKRDEAIPYFTAYNFTDRQNQVQDLFTIIKALKENKYLSEHIDLIATGNTGITGLLLSAIPHDLDRIVIDGNHFNPSEDQHMLELQIPGIMRIGGLKTILALGANQPILIYNAHPNLKYPGVDEVVKLVGNEDHLSISASGKDVDEVIEFLRL